MLRHFIARVTFGLPKWQKVGCIGCGGALATILLLLVPIFVIGTLNFTGPIGGYDYQGAELIENSVGAVRTPRWTSDGQAIVVNIGNAIYGVSADGNDLWRIPKQRGGHQHSPTLAHNGRIAYLQYRPYGSLGRLSRYDIEMVDLNGDQVEHIAYAGRKLRHPIISPDGAFVAFSTTSDTGESVIRVASNHDLSSFDIAISDECYLGRLIWSNDSKQIIAVCHLHIDSINIANNNITTIVPNTGENILTPVLSKDSAAIYFSRFHFSNYTGAIYAVSSDGVEENLMLSLEPNWMAFQINASYDGSALTFVAVQPWRKVIEPRDYCAASQHYVFVDPNDPRYLTYLVNSDGTNPRIILSDAGVADPADACERGLRYWTAWAPNSKRIAVYDNAPDAPVALYTMAADGTDAKVLIRRDDDGDLMPGYAEPFATTAGATGSAP